MEQIPEDKRVYMDESGITENLTQENSWSPKGEPTQAKRTGKRTKRTNLITAIRQNRTFAAVTFEGACKTDTFIEWIERFLLPKLEAGLTIIMDNATFHKAAKVRELIESVGCKLLFLPPYSPDLNPERSQGDPIRLTRR